MSRMTGAKCKLCRREGTKLFLKGERCFSEKCAMNRRPYPPGRSATFLVRRSTYGMQIREKQKVKRIYGLNEAQLKRVLSHAIKRKGDKGLRLLQLLELRLDNVVYVLGLAVSKASARQLVSHGKITVNGKKVTIPSYTVKVGDKIATKDASVQTSSVSGLKAPAWIKRGSRGGEVVAEPSRSMIDDGINESLVIEFYSR